MDLNSISNVSSTDDLTQAHDYTGMILGILFGVVVGFLKCYAQPTPPLVIETDGQDVAGAVHMELEV